MFVAFCVPVVMESYQEVRVKCISYQAPPCPVFTLIGETVALTGNTEGQERTAAIFVVTRLTFLKKKNTNAKTYKYIYI